VDYTGASGSNTTDTVTVNLDGIVADTTTQSAVIIDIDAESTNALTITGSKGNNDTINIDGAVDYGAETVTISAVEKLTIDDDVTFKAATLSGQTLSITGASSDVITLNGTAAADTIDTSNLTATANALITIDAGVGADTITLGAMDETLIVDAAGADSGATVATADSITGFTLTVDATGAGEDVGDLIDISGATAAIGSTTSDANVSSVSAAGKITFADATLTLAELIVDAATVTAAAGQAAFFVNGGDTYLVIEDSSNVDDLFVLSDTDATSLLLNAGLTATIATDQIAIA
jgi:predicted RNA-binding protein with TRAM domain